MNAFSKRVAALLTAIVLTACNDGLIYSEWTSINLASARINADPATPVAIKLGFDRNVVAVAPPIGGTAEQTSTATMEGSQGPGSGITSAAGSAATTCEMPSASRGEAVSEFSTFSVNVSTPFVGTPAGTPTGTSTGTTAGTPVAAPAGTSAGAADWRHTWVHSRFASGGAALEIACQPRIVAALLGFTPLTRLGPDDIPLLGKLSDCVNAMDQQGLNELALTLDIILSETEQHSEQQARQAITSRFLDSESDQLKDYATKMQPSCPT